MWEVQDDNLLQYRCRSGHLYSPDSLLTAHNSHLEGALWSAVRTLEENASLLRRLSIHMQEQGNVKSMARYAGEADLKDQQALLIRRQLLMNG